MSCWNLDKLIPLMLEAKDVALEHFRVALKEYKTDNSIVTAGDKAVEALLTKALEDTSNKVFFLGEETIESKPETYLDQAFQHTAWVVDPIDGTAPFANGLPTWAVSIGYMEKGILKDGIVLLPVLGELYFTDRGHVIKQTYTGKANKELISEIKLSAPNFQDLPKGTMVALSQQAIRSEKLLFPNYIQVTGSSVFNMVKLAEGCFSGMITKFKIWDFAGALPMLLNLNWHIEFQKGGLFSPNMNQDGIIHKAPGDPKRWETQDTLLFASGESGTEFLRKNLRLN